MHITSRPLDETAMLFEEQQEDGQILRVLVLKEGLLCPDALAEIEKLLGHL